MNANDSERSASELLQDNILLRTEVRAARQAADITAELVADQFIRAEEVLRRLEEKAEAERELKGALAEKLRETEERARELARERRRLEEMQVASLNMMEDMTAARRAAEAATQVKSEFLANMSHEIRTPMTAILGFAELVQGEVGCCTTCPQHEGCATRKTVCNHIETICANGRHLLDLISDILDLSKIEAGKMEVEHVTCSPWEIVGDVTSLMRVRAREKGLLLQLRHRGPIPETILSDPSRLRQILVNLVGNAIKFTQHGEVRMEVQLLGAQSADPQIQFEVVDTGIGMTEKQIAKLFRPFNQADSSTTRKHGGTGLGLTISKQFALLLGGDISVSSAHGKGSTFTATVPTGPLDGVRLLDDLTEAETRVSDQRGSAARQDVALDCRVLLAEDGYDNQRLISFVLRKAGAEVTVADNGQVALDLALAARQDGRPFDVILMDMQMPVLDGYRATRGLRQAGYTGPIIALTAHAMKSDRDKCLSTGCDDYTTKPIDRPKLLSLIARYASRADTSKAP